SQPGLEVDPGARSAWARSDVAVLADLARRILLAHGPRAWAHRLHLWPPATDSADTNDERNTMVNMISRPATRISPAPARRRMRGRMRGRIRGISAASACALICAALLAGACSGPRPELDTKQSAVSADLPFVSGNVISTLGSGDNGTAYLVEINGQRLV